MSKADFTRSPSPRSTRPSPRLWRWYCILAALEAGAAIVVLLAVPKEGPGLSWARLGVLTLLLGALLFFAFLARTWAEPPRLPVALPRLFSALILIIATSLYLLRYLDPDSLLPYYQRLSIPLFYALALCLQALVLSILPLWKGKASSFRSLLSKLRWAGLAWAILLLTLALVALTGIGITPDPAYWGEPGVPILGWQIAIALLCGVLTLPFSLRYTGRSRLDATLGGTIWLLAVLAWLLVPISVLQNSFYAPIRPPAYVPFPNSDAGYYDSMAQSLAIGYPYQGDIPSRPLYVLLLAGLHLLFGERYDLIIVGQTLILALIPVLLYLIGSAVHSRPAGVIAAVAAIGREWTSLMVSSATRVSNSKMLLVDMPTLLAILLCCLLVIGWLKRQDVLSAAIAGGAYAILLLLRTQTLALLPILLVFAALAGGIRRRSLLTQLTAFLVAGALTLAPWLLHNFLATGQLALDAPFQYRIIASQYRYTGNLDIQSLDLEGKSVFGMLAAFAVHDPAFVLGFIVNHALATQVGGVMALPLLHSFPGLLAGVETYWAAWNGSLSPANLVLVTFYLAIIAVGLAAAWARLRWVGLVPLGLSLGYSLTNGIARFSGWRYDLPADWTAYFYFAVGVAEILLILSGLFGVTVPSSPPTGSGQEIRRPMLPFRGLVPIFTAFAIVGALPWFASQFASPRYTWATPQELESRLAMSPAMPSAAVTSEFIHAASLEPGAVLKVGRVLYPRFFSRGTGLASAHPWPAYAPRDFPRLGFLLLNEARQDVLLPTRLAPEGLEHAADAIVLGCQRDGYIEARRILMLETGVVIQAASVFDSCE